MVGDASQWKKNTVLYCAATTLICLGDTCYSAAMLPILTDQIIGATTDELGAVVRWYYWAKHIGYGLCDIAVYLIIDRYGTKFEAVLFFAIPLSLIIISDCHACYASVGGATGHTVVVLCICLCVCVCVCVCVSVCRQDFSSLAEN